MKTKLQKTLTFVCLTFSAFLLNAQDQPLESRWFGAISLNEAYRFEESELSKPGASYRLWFRAHRRVGVQFQTGFLLWNESDMNTFYTTLGFNLSVVEFKKSIISLYGAAGTSAVIGKDYGAFFGLAEAGVQYLPTVHKSVSFALSWKQNTIFHPSHFSYLDFSAGFVF